MPPHQVQVYRELDPDARQRLEALKRRIQDQFPERTRHYDVEWDRQGERIRGLEAFGELVFRDLWTALDEETRDFIQQPASTWQEDERRALEEFAAEQSRRFFGRTYVVEDLCRFALSADESGAAWCTCVVGGTGDGKSALLGPLLDRLRGADAFVLAHFVAMSPHAARLDTMFARWCDELAAKLGEASPLGANERRPLGGHDADEAGTRNRFEEEYRGLLSRVAQHHRVVILVDGLSQFERSTEARFVAWLRNGVPPNTRLIVTTAPGEELQTLTGRAGVQLLPLPTLDTDASEQIALAICQSYHRELNPDVLHELLRKRTRDGREAAGNPLASLQPDNIEWQQRIIGQYSGLGAVHWVKGEVQAALDSARQATQLGELAASQRPNDDEWLAETSLLYVNLGDILAKAGDGSGSIEAYRKCLAVRQRLASRAPTDGKRQVELSMGYEYLGDALHSQGRPGEAIQAQQQCLEIRQQLVSQAPGDAAPLRALVVTHTRLANLHQDLGQIKASNGHWIECHRLLSRMRNQGLELDPTFADLLRQLDKALGSA